MSVAFSFSLPAFAPGRPVVLRGRGTTYVRELPGPQGAPVLLLLHGWTATAALNWFAAMPELAADFHVIAMDLRGHGRGIRSEEPFTLEDCADDAAALLEELGVERAVVAGYSMGGPVAKLLWRRHPERVAGLVLCSTAAHFPLRLPLMYPLGLLAKGMALLPGFLVRQRALPGLSWIPQLRLLDEIARGDAAALCEAGVCIGRFDARDWVGGIDVPTSVVVTTADELVAPRMQYALARAIPGARVHRVAAAHLAAGLSPEWVPVFLEACAAVAGESAPAHDAGRPARAASVIAFEGSAA